MFRCVATMRNIITAIYHMDDPTGCAAFNLRKMRQDVKLESTTIVGHSFKIILISIQYFRRGHAHFLLLFFIVTL